MTQVLEQMLSSVGTEVREETPQTIDIYMSGLSQMYTGPVHPPGLMGAQPFQTGYNFPGTGTQLHLHGPDNNTITYGTIMDQNRNVLSELNGYESSMAALRAENLGFKKFP